MKITHRLIFMCASLFLISTTVMADTSRCIIMPFGVDAQSAFIADEGSGHVVTADITAPVIMNSVPAVYFYGSDDGINSNPKCMDNGTLLQPRHLISVSRVAVLADNFNGIDVGFGGGRGFLSHMISSTATT